MVASKYMAIKRSIYYTAFYLQNVIRSNQFSLCATMEEERLYDAVGILFYHQFRFANQRVPHSDKANDKEQ